MTDWSGICDKTPQTHGVMQRQPTVCLTMDVKNQGTYCSTQMIFIVLPQPLVPTDNNRLVLSSCKPLEVFAPVFAKLLQSLALLVQFVFKPVTVEFVPTTDVWTSLVNGNENTPFAVVVPIMVVPSERRYSLFGLNIQFVCSEVPPVAQFGVVQAIRLVPSATIAL